jgi:hypothetical protein
MAGKIAFQIFERKRYCRCYRAIPPGKMAIPPYLDRWKNGYVVDFTPGENSNFSSLGK